MDALHVALLAVLDARPLQRPPRLLAVVADRDRDQAQHAADSLCLIGIGSAMADSSRPTTSCCSAPPGSPAALTAEYLAAHAPAGRRVGAGRAQPGEARGRCGEARRDDPRCADLPLLRRPTSPTRRRCASVAGPPAWSSPRSARTSLRRAARRRLRRGRHRLRRPDRRAGVRRPDVPAPPRAGAARPAPGSCTPAGSTPSRTTWARCSPSSSCPRASRSTLRGYVRAGGTPSGGTFALGAHRASPRVRQTAAAQRERATPSRAGRPARRAAPGRPHRDARAGALGAAAADDRPADRAPLRARARRATAPTSPTATTPRSSTCRSAVGGWPAWPALFAPRRSRRPASCCSSRIQPGDGPSREQRAKGWFKVRSSARAAASGSSPRFRRRPRLRRDGEDARRVGAVPGPRRPAGDRRPGHHRPGDGRPLLERLERHGITFRTV